MAPSTSRSPLYDGCPPESSWNRVPHFQSSGPWASSSISSEPRQADPTADEVGQEEEEADEWEYEETEDLIMLDLGSKSARLAHMSHEYTVTGLETDHPFFKLGNLTFKGRWDQLLGTELLLHLDRDPTKAKNEQTVITPFGPSPAPSSSRPAVPGAISKRVVLEPASNLSEREAALLRPLNATDGPSAVEKRAAAPLALVSYKDFRWVRGVGWVHKDDVGEAISAQAEEQEESDADEEGQGLADDGASDGEAGAGQPDGGVKLTKRGKPKKKRQPMTEVQKAKANLKRALHKLEKDNPNLKEDIEKRKDQIKVKEEGEGQDEDEEDVEDDEEGQPQRDAQAGGQADEQMDTT